MRRRFGECWWHVERLHPFIRPQTTWRKYRRILKLCIRRHVLAHNSYNQDSGNSRYDNMKSRRLLNGHNCNLTHFWSNIFLSMMLYEWQKLKYCGCKILWKIEYWSHQKFLHSLMDDETSVFRDKEVCVLLCHLGGKWYSERKWLFLFSP